jgi:putative endonuclease
MRLSLRVEDMVVRPARHPESNGASYRMGHYVYIVRCVDGTLYVGSARDLEERLKAHNDGRGAAYTFKRRPVRLIYSETLDSHYKALARERQLKRWSHGKKQALIEGNLERLKRLSRRRS